jgi:hypothetical protein
LTIPKVLGDIDKLVNADIEKNSDKHATDMAGRLLKEAVNPAATGQLESERIRKINASLKNFRNLGPSARSLTSDLEGDCNSVVESVQGKIKGFIGGLLEKLLSGTSEVVGGGGYLSFWRRRLFASHAPWIHTFHGCCGRGWTSALCPPRHNH